MTIRPWMEREYTITRWTELDFGRHFLAMEHPGALVDDVRAFFTALR